MDGFDDLLTHSRAELDHNPFSDPFQRADSPDPWSSPFGGAGPQDEPSAFHDDSHAFKDDDHHHAFQDDHHGHEDGQNAYADDESPKSPTRSEEPATPASEAPPTSATTTPADPLDSAALTADSDEEDNSRFPRKPGFRQASPPREPSPTPEAETKAHAEQETPAPTPATFSETATIRPSEPEEYAPPPPSHSPTTSTPARSPSPPTTAAAAPRPAHAKVPSRASADWGPLSRPLQPAAYDALAIGGESAGGWQQHQDTTAAWGSASAPAVPAPAPPTAQEDDDSDDDKPIGQRLAQSQTLQAKSPTRKDKDEPPATFIISVDDPQKVGDPIRPYIMYTVHTQTSSKEFRKPSFSVLRRYSDFLWLYETLSLNNPGVVVPPVPGKNPFGRFDDQFVKQRRLGLEKCIQKIANHPVLGKDADLRLFLESDTFSLDIKHRKSEIAHERGGMLGSLGQVLTGPRFHETDEWFDRKKVYMDGLENQLRGLVKAIELVSKQRSDLATATGDFAATVADLSSSDVGKGLSTSLAGLADIERKAQDLQNIQAEQDIITLLATVDEYARLINSVRMAFTGRIRTYHAWKQADADLARQRSTHDRNRAQGKIPNDRMGYAMTQLAEAERRALEAKREFEHVSRLAKEEVARFEKERIEDFKAALQAFLEGMIARQKEVIAAWEAYQQRLLTRMGARRESVEQPVNGA
ncbi:Vps5 C terminal like-domain-containing protein [Schizophyllum commune]